MVVPECREGAALEYVVRYGDRLDLIAQCTLGAAWRWREIASLNHIDQRRVEIFVGQRLRLPFAARIVVSPDVCRADRAHARTDGTALLLPATRTLGLGHVFFIADEWNPAAKKLVRRVVVIRGDAADGILRGVLNPERHGFTPRDPASPVSLGRHVLGRNDSRFISASELPKGAARFGGEPFWIDVGKLRASGAVIHDAAAIGADLDRIAAKARDPAFRAQIERIRALSLADAEVVVEGAIPAGAVKGAGMMAATRGMQFVAGVGIVLTIYDLEQASVVSYRTRSARPIAAATVRQVGGWGGAWAGAELLGAGGAAVGIETGPGALVTGAIGAVIGGFLGYFGADVVARHIEER
jgi:hypothetical protein